MDRVVIFSRLRLLNFLTTAVAVVKCLTIAVAVVTNAKIKNKCKHFLNINDAIALSFTVLRSSLFKLYLIRVGSGFHFWYLRLHFKGLAEFSI